MAPFCGAAEVQRSYFIGEVKLSSETGKPIGSQAILVSKVYDPDKNSMTERAIIVDPDGKVDDYPMNMAIKGDTFTIDDPKKVVEGSGTFFGPTGHWTYFKGTYKATNGVTIEDENFTGAPDIGCARKKLTTADGKVLMYMDMALKSTTRETFEILAAALLKKPASQKPKQSAPMGSARALHGISSPSHLLFFGESCHARSRTHLAGNWPHRGHPWNARSGHRAVARRPNT